MTLFFTISFSAQFEQKLINDLTSVENTDFMVDSLNQRENLSQDSDKAQVLQKCIDLPDIQQYLAKNSDGSFIPIHIMQYPIAFSNNLNLSKFEESVIFQSRQEISSNNVKSFFIFKVLSIDVDTAQVEFDYYNNTKESQIVEITASLQKSVSEWEIVDLTLNQK
jgi:hypothetical protein